MFSHSLEAFESEWDCKYGDRGGCEGSGSPPDPLFYHIKLNFKVIETSGKGVKIKWNGWVGWIPKSIIKNDNYVHLKTFISIIKSSIDNKNIRVGDPNG